MFSGFDTIRVCTRYRGDDEATFDTFPYHQSVLHHATGEYVDLPGWSEDITGCRSWADLPEAAREYLDFIADFIGVPIVLVGVGPGREQIIWTAGGRPPRRRRGLSVEASSSTTRSPRRSMRRARASGREHRDDGERDLHADDALLGPVDVVELEQQRGLVERQGHAGAEGDARARDRAPRCAPTTDAPPARKASTMPGTKWWMWWLADDEVAERPEAPAPADGVRREPDDGPARS